MCKSRSEGAAVDLKGAHTNLLREVLGDSAQSSELPIHEVAKQHEQEEDDSGDENGDSNDDGHAGGDGGGDGGGCGCGRGRGGVAERWCS